MSDIIIIVVPVAALVLLGWCAGTFKYLPAEATSILPAFAFRVTMPALIIRAFLSVDELPVAPESMIAVYFGAVALIWIATTLVVIFVLRRPVADAAPIAMGASFSNTVMLGLPLSFSAFGPEAAIPAAIIIAVDTPLLWLLAVLQIEASQGGRRGSFWLAVRPVIGRLLTNPIILATLAGVAGRLAGVQLGAMPARFLDLLADAAIPTALIALGLSLSTFRLGGQTPTLIAMTVIKLLLFPAIVFFLGAYVLSLPPLWFAVALLFAALPVGANPYLFAAQYGRAEGALSASIAVTTVLSLASVSLILLYLNRFVL